MLWNRYEPRRSIWQRRIPDRRSPWLGVRAFGPVVRRDFEIVGQPAYRCGSCGISWYDDPECPGCGVDGTMLDKRAM